MKSSDIERPELNLQMYDEVDISSKTARKFTDISLHIGSQTATFINDNVVIH